MTTNLEYSAESGLTPFGKSRRRTLETLLVLGTSALVNNCVTLDKAPDTTITDYQHQQSRNLESRIILKSNEYPVPDDVFDAYVSLVMQDSQDTPPPEAVSILRNAFTIFDRYSFYNRLKRLSYNEGEISLYYTILSTPYNIVFKESLLSDEGRLRDAIIHERFHQEMRALSYKEKSQMNSAYLRLRRSGHSFLQFKGPYHGHQSTFITLDMEEFYAYLAEGAFEPNVEATFRTRFQDAYAIFERIRSMSIPKTKN